MLNVVEEEFIMVAPFMLIPLGLAMMRSAFLPAISILPCKFEGRGEFT